MKQRLWSLTNCLRELIKEIVKAYRGTIFFSLRLINHLLLSKSSRKILSAFIQVVIVIFRIVENIKKRVYFSLSVFFSVENVFFFRSKRMNWLMNLGKPVRVFFFHKFAYFFEIRGITEFPNV